MNNLKLKFNRIKTFLTDRWKGEDYPGGQARFQVGLLAQDVAVFVLLPLLAIIFFRACERIGLPAKKTQGYQSTQRELIRSDGPKSQVIEFHARSGTVSAAKRSPGSLVKVRLQNVVETYSNAPVHAQIIDGGLGKTLLGGTLIGDATPDPTFERINISFHYVRDPNQDGVAFSVAARALSLDGTLGLTAMKKEAFFTRAVLGSANGLSQNALSKDSGSGDLKDILFRALAAGFSQEFSSGVQTEKSRSQVLSLQPNTEFFAELTDFFPGSSK